MIDVCNYYVIGYKEEVGKYLDEYDNQCKLSDAMRFKSYEDAEEYRKNIDVAYLFETRNVTGCCEYK